MAAHGERAVDAVRDLLPAQLAEYDTGILIVAALTTTLAFLGKVLVDTVARGLPSAEPRACFSLQWCCGWCVEGGEKEGSTSVC